MSGTTDWYYHYDPIGNVLFITDSYGNITASYVQEGFGNVIASSSGLVPNSYHLTTKELEHHPATGLYYFGARWYDP
ncbi:MAG: type IV secretion protein Rhs, partial [bacterium]|nr:type IV secretion protein Rhs [bacterium]